MAKFSFIPTDKKGNYRISAFTVSLFIAIVFWLLNSLSKSYSYKTTFDLVYKEIPFNKQPSNPLPKTANIIFEGKGFDLLWLNIKKPFKDLKIFMPIGTNNDLPKTFNMAVADCFLKQYRTNSQDLRISYTEPDSIHFVFTQRIVKKVPIKFNTDISYRKRYGSTLGLVPQTDSITIAGSNNVLEKISQLETEHISLLNLSSNTSVSLKLINPDSTNIFLSTTTINAQIKVEETTEAFVNVNVSSHIQSGRIMLIPSSVKVSFNTTLENAKNISPSDFLVTAVPSDNGDDYAIPIVKSQPPYITVVFVDPPRLKILKEN